MSLVTKCTYNFCIQWSFCCSLWLGKVFYKYYTSTFPFPHYCEYVVLDCNLCGIHFDWLIDWLIEFCTLCDAWCTYEMSQNSWLEHCCDWRDWWPELLVVILKQSSTVEPVLGDPWFGRPLILGDHNRRHGSFLTIKYLAWATTCHTRPATGSFGLTNDSFTCYERPDNAALGNSRQ